MADTELNVPGRLDIASTAGAAEQRLSRYLRATRLIRGIPFMRLVELTGIPENDLEGLEAGSISVSEFRYGWLPKLAEHLQCPLDELYMVLGNERVLRYKRVVVPARARGYAEDPSVKLRNSEPTLHSFRAKGSPALVPPSEEPTQAVTVYRRTEPRVDSFSLLQLPLEEDDESNSSSTDTEKSSV